MGLLQVAKVYQFASQKVLFRSHLIGSFVQQMVLFRELRCQIIRVRLFVMQPIRVIYDKRIDMNKFHEMMGHCGTEKLQKTANIHGFKLVGNVEVCQDCAIAKARQKNFNKEWKGGSQVAGERLYLDIRF